MPQSQVLHIGMDQIYVQNLLDKQVINTFCYET